ncbi:MAG: hypothetical protein FJW37_08825 [Acidobacteria bacterium]|nr:hypothetical protein [Acidobacteriota bacterium]
MRALVAAAILAALAPAAEDSGIRGPVSGFVFGGPSGEIRPIVGRPGAAYLGAAVGGKFDLAAPSPEADAALTVRGGELWLVRNLEGAPAGQRIERALAGIDRIAWSRGGAALVYSSASGRAQRVQDGEITADFELPAGLNALAVDGARLFVTFGEASQARVGENEARVGEEASVGENEGRVWEIEDFGRGSALLPFTGGSGGAGRLELSADGRRLLVAEGRTVAVYDVQSRSLLERIELDFEASALRRLRDNLFLLNAGSEGQPAYVLETGAEPLVYFVPSGGGE